MPIQDRHIAQLRTIYQKHYGKSLSPADAWAMAHRLVTLFRILIEHNNRAKGGEVRTVNRLPDQGPN